MRHYADSIFPPLEIAVADGNNNNLTLGASTILVLRETSGGNPSTEFNVTGFSGGSQTRVITVWNTTGQNCRFKHNSSSSSSGNKMSMTNDAVFAPYQCAKFHYLDGAWRIVFTNVAAASGTGTPVVLFTQTTDKAGSYPGSPSLVGAGVGSMTLPSDYMTVGKTLRLTASGLITTDAAAQAMYLSLWFGAVEIAQALPDNLSPSQTNLVWMLDALITCRSTGGTGAIVANGLWTAGNRIFSSNVAGVSMRSYATTVDTTGSALIDFTHNGWPSSPVGSIITKNLMLMGLN